MPKNIIAYTYKAASEGLNAMYHEFGGNVSLLQGVSVGLDPAAAESRLVVCLLELLDKKDNPSSQLILGTKNGINRVYFPLMLEVQYPETLKVTLADVPATYNIWFKVVVMQMRKVMVPDKVELYRI